MRPNEALAAWSQACDCSGIDWYLHRDTLLCANGYDQLPEALACAQIVVRGSDMPRIWGEILPRLPVSWQLDLVGFVTQKRVFCFLEGEVPVLSVDVLSSVRDQQDMEDLLLEFKKIRRSAGRKMRSLRHIPFDLGMAKREKVARKAAAKLVELLGSRDEGLALYTDGFTGKTPALMEKSLFEEKQLLSCGGVDYPVYGGYTTYLELAYGDYRQGLTDEIGVGLTVEEKQELKIHQQHCLQALAFVQEVSREFGLRYYLLAGSVLGAVRHGGFIPWDDDVDIGIRAEELDRFEEVIRQELPKRLPQGFELIQPDVNFAYPRVFSKICYEGRCCMDLWPLVPTYVSGLRAKFTWVFGKLMTKVHYWKIGRRTARHSRIIRLASFFLTDKMALSLVKWNRLKYARRKTPAYINLHSIYRREKETILRAWLEDERTANFDGLEVPVVGCTEEYLTHLYGNYMAKPAPWKRASRHIARF